MAANITADISHLNSEEALRQIPLAIFLSILSIFGFTGNILVIYIYGKIYTNSNSRVFIIFLAIVDLCTCAMAIPLEIMILLNQYEFNSPNVCKASRFINSLTVVTSSSILIFIAVDRYRKICHPLGWHISNKAAKLLCLTSVAISAFFNWPLLFLYGTKTVPLPRYNLNGTECSVDDKFVPTVYPLLHNGASAGIFIIGVLILVVLYSLIGKKVRFFAKKLEFREASSETIEERTPTDHKQRREKLESVNKELSSRGSLDASVSVLNSEDEKVPGCERNKGKHYGIGKSSIKERNMSQSMETIVSDKTEPSCNTIGYQEQNIDDTSGSVTKTPETEVTPNSKNNDVTFGFARIASLKVRVSRMRKNRKTTTIKPARKKLAKNTTYLMLVISLAFVISFVPYLLLTLVRTVDKKFVDNLTNEGRATYRFFLRSYFLNCAVNPVLYSIFDMRFRKVFKSLILSLKTKTTCSKTLRF